MTRYFVLLALNLIVMAFACKMRKGKRFYYWFTIIQLTILFGFRGETVGTDTRNYITMFHEIGRIDTFKGIFSDPREIGYVILNRFVYLFTNSYTVLFIICGFIIALGFIKFIKDNTENLYLGAFLLITLMMFFTSMNAIRQYLSIAIGINSITYFKRKSYFKYFLAIIVACLFHKTSLLYLCVPIIGLIAKFKPLKIIFYICVITVAVLPVSIIAKFVDVLGYDYYLDFLLSEGGGGVTMIILSGAIIAFALLSFYSNKNYKKNEIEFLILPIILALSILANNISWLILRIVWQFSPILLVLIPNCMIGYKKTEKYGFTFMIGIACILYFIYCLINNWQGIVPYVWQIG